MASVSLWLPFSSSPLPAAWAEPPPPLFSFAPASPSSYAPSPDQLSGRQDMLHPVAASVPESGFSPPWKWKTITKWLFLSKGLFKQLEFPSFSIDGKCMTAATTASQKAGWTQRENFCNHTLLRIYLIVKLYMIMGIYHVLATLIKF